MKYSDQAIKSSFHSKAFALIMGFLITSFIAVFLTVAGLLTTHNWSTNRSLFSSKFKGNSQKPISSASFSPLLLQLKPSYDVLRKRQSVSRVARYDGFSEGFYGGAVEKSDFYYILPILLVIGLGSFLIPIISTFFTALVTSNGAIGGCCGRRRKRRHQDSRLNMKAILGIDNIYDILETVEKAIEKLTNNFENE